jgi:hypothetical protein
MKKEDRDPGMSMTSHQVSSKMRGNEVVEHRFATCLAFAMLAVATAGFVPSLLHTSGRRAPLSPLAAAHGIVFFVWLGIFLVQSRLVATQKIAWHRRVGVAAAFVLAVMIPLGFAAAAAMVRRGFDLSGDLRIDHDPAYESVFPFGDLMTFSVLVIAALAYRGQAEIHKRLMLFANIALMGAPLAHFIGHTPWLALLPAAIILVPLAMFLGAAVMRDFLVSRRVHPLTLALALGMFISGPLRAFVIGPSVVWHRFANWVAQ